MVSKVRFRKGHGTGNDFIVLPDPHDELGLSPTIVRALCHRRFGLGADGVLRVVPGTHGWFMDYWNSDGTVAQMCGNGARVFARHLVQAGMESVGTFEFETRGGIRRATVTESGDVSVAMGPVTGVADEVTVSLGERRLAAVAAFAPNPHAVVFLPTLDGLGDISGATAGPDRIYPQGANVEFVAVSGPDRVTMRVWERGSGETLSCGTGACAAAWAHQQVNGFCDDTVTVDVPGGAVRVSLADPQNVVLSGPAEFVASGFVDSAWWSSNS
jgi:diaminopimelate epimerase